VVRVGEPKDSRLSARTLGDFRRLLVGSPDYFARRGVPRSPADLASHACLHYRYPSSGKIEQWALRRAADAAELTLPTAMICNNIETRLCFALQGLGIAYLPDFAVREPLAGGKLVSVLGEYVDAGATFRILWPASRHPSPKLRAFIDFLAARVFAPQRRD
jgi:DNA-binding transcriptional LysR family regulator